MFLKKDVVKITNKMDENNFLFVRYVYGFKEVPYNIFGMIVNNEDDDKISLYYLVDGKVKEKSVSTKNIREKSYSVRVRSSEYKKTYETSANKYRVLKEIKIAGKSLTDLINDLTFNKLVEKLEKTPMYNANLEFEISMNYSYRGKINSIVFTSYKDPKKFIDKIKVYAGEEKEVKVKEKKVPREKKTVREKKIEARPKKRVLKTRNKKESKK